MFCYGASYMITIHFARCPHKELLQIKGKMKSEKAWPRWPMHGIMKTVKR